jgi:uncharacterized surface protein with fasciclin (FAS1) repeats
MKILKSTLTLAMLGAITLTSAQQQKGPDASEMSKTENVETTTTEPTIVGVASSNEAFSTLVTAVKAANLVGTLDGAGPFTVFAPTNDAFAKLPAGTVEGLLKDENIPTLTKILTYHVVAGEYKAADVVKAIQANNNSFAVETVAGVMLTLSLQDGAVILTDAAGNNSTVTATDVAASNGVIHVIDTVVMPN